MDSAGLATGRPVIPDGAGPIAAGAGLGAGFGAAFAVGRLAGALFGTERLTAVGRLAVVVRFVLVRLAPVRLAPMRLAEALAADLFTVERLPVALRAEAFFLVGIPDPPCARASARDSKLVRDNCATRTLPCVL